MNINFCSKFLFEDGGLFEEEATEEEDKYA
jgi:hypothetical protein